MKKQLLSFALCLAFFQFSNAQETTDSPKHQTSFGFKAGFSQNYILNDSRNYSDFNFYTGFWATTSLSEKWGFQYEIIYSRIVENDDSRAGADQNFLEFPLLLKYHLDRKWSFLLGPKLEFSLDDKYSSVDNFGITPTVGIEYKLNKRLFLESRFSYGLKQQYLKDRSTGDVDHKTSIRLGIGYKF